jgi:hypothetical protein
LLTLHALQEDSTVYTLKCNISVDVNYLHQGVALALVEDREKNSAQVGAVFLETGAVKAALPADAQHCRPCCNSRGTSSNSEAASFTSKHTCHISTSCTGHPLTIWPAMAAGSQAGAV